MVKANKQPSCYISTQEKVFDTLKKIDGFISLTSLSRKAKVNYYQTRSVITFFEKLKLVEFVNSDGGTGLVKLKDCGGKQES